ACPTPFPVTTDRCLLCVVFHLGLDLPGHSYRRGILAAVDDGRHPFRYRRQPAVRLSTLSRGAGADLAAMESRGGHWRAAAQFRQWRGDPGRAHGRGFGRRRADGGHRAAVHLALRLLLGGPQYRSRMGRDCARPDRYRPVEHGLQPASQPARGGPAAARRRDLVLRFGVEQAPAAAPGRHGQRGGNAGGRRGAAAGQLCPRRAPDPDAHHRRLDRPGLPGVPRLHRRLQRLYVPAQACAPGGGHQLCLRQPGRGGVVGDPLRWRAHWLARVHRHGRDHQRRGVDRFTAVAQAERGL
ncbi:Uncharacterized inner membrane transporter YedA, partial [Pseudomonas sp. FEN]